MAEGMLERDAIPRGILVRPGVGAAGRVIQNAALTSHRITVEQPTLILVDEGIKRIAFLGGTCTARVGDALSLEAGAVVDIANTPGESGQYRARWISWGDDMLDGHLAPRPSEHPVPVMLHTDVGEAFRTSFDVALNALRNAAALPSTIATSRLQELLLWLAERGFQFAPAPPLSIARRVRHVLASDPAVDWSMEAVAEQMAMSIATLRRKLALEGTGFRGLIQDVRMAHVLALLQNTDAPVLNVAFAVGYDSASRFATRFRSRFGFLPSDIRGQSRGRPATLSHSHLVHATS